MLRFLLRRVLPHLLQLEAQHDEINEFGKASYDNGRKFPKLSGEFQKLFKTHLIVYSILFCAIVDFLRLQRWRKI